MTFRKHLGEFEHMLLLAILRLRENAYGPNITRLLEDEAERQISRGALYATLDRLEDKGYLRWKVASTTPQRAGHRRRLFSVTPEGIQALAESREVLMKLWRGLGSTLSRPAR